MKRRLIRAIKSESGQALPVVLVLLLLGGLLIAPTLSYASTSLNAGRIVEKNVNGLYAADAGIEDVLWKLKNNLPVPYFYQLPENVNLMPVSIQTDIIGIYTLYFGELVKVGEPPQSHYDWVTVDGEMVLVDEELQVYKYTITVTWQPQSGQSTIHLEEIGVRLPVGYSYQLDSAAGFPSNLSTDPPSYDILDGAGAHMLNWELPPPRPEVSELDPTRTQIFYVTGEGEQEGDYTWVVADPSSIGVVGEVIGGLYRITATATRPGDVDPTAIIMADAMWNEIEEEITILLWQINPQ